MNDYLTGFWSEIKHFSPEEFISPRDDDANLLHGLNMDEKLIRILDTIRITIGKPLKINSGYRSPAYNAAIGGKPKSQHPQYKAADIHIDSQEMGDEIESLARELGIGGVGRYNTFIHLDTREGNAYWDFRQNL